jgi:hypothetical protein
VVRFLSQVASYQEADQIENGAARDAVQRATMESLNGQVNARLQRLHGYLEPASLPSRQRGEVD